MIIKKCAFFRCKNKSNCSNKGCSGCGGAAYQNCGCDACSYQSWAGNGDVEICEIALMIRESEMEEKECLG